MYCAEAELRKTVTLFEPLPSQLAYPDLLEHPHTQNNDQKPASGTNTAASRLLAKAGKPTPGGGTSIPASTADNTATDSDNGGGNDNSQDLSRTWYPPLKHTLSLLSLLYGVVDPAVFEVRINPWSHKI